MNTIGYINSNNKKYYLSNSFFGRIKDRFNIKLNNNIFIKDLNINILSIKIPCNIHKISYYRNIEISKKFLKKKDFLLAPKVYRSLDYTIFNDFQKRFLFFSIIKSIQVILRIQGKSIKNSCIVIYDAVEEMAINIVFELCKYAKYIVLLSKSKDIRKLNYTREIIIENYGISPIITNDINYVVRNADFIISSKFIQINKVIPIWYLDNLLKPYSTNVIPINDVTYSVPWNLENLDASIELLAAILYKIGEKDINRVLKYYGIFLNKIKFNTHVLGADFKK